MSKVVSSSVGLKSQLQLRHYFFVYGNFKRNVRNGNLLCEPAFDLSDAVPDFSLRVLLVHKVLDLNDGLDDVLDAEKDALASHHVADLEGHLRQAFESFLKILLVGLFLALQHFLDGAFCLPFELFALEKHLFLNPHHRLGVWVVGVVLETHFVAEAALQTGSLNEVFEMLSASAGNPSVVSDDFFEFNLFVA